MIKNVPLKSLYSFIAVAESSSMVHAAEQLSVSHSAVSQAIKSLEAKLNTQLFTRHGRTVSLNSVGKRYYQRVLPAIEEIIAASQEASHSQLPQPYITLNMVNSMALHWWIPRVAQFQSAAPQIDVRLSNLVGEFDLERQGVDAALIHGHAKDWTKYQCEKLGDDELILVCSPQLLKDTIQDIQTIFNTYPAIFVENPRRLNDWQVWCDAKNLKKPRQHKNLTFSISVQATQAAMRQLGILVTHKQFVRDDIKHGMLIQIDEPVLNPYQQFYFATTKAKAEQDDILQLKEWLKLEFTKGNEY
ncbi:LysR family transcriptional regulator [Pseudoalteromonas sp. A601]|uniref:LysR substrate-binding domain-containing protein n=1 Tax=Pseudoalteromonas sp. A601 TaxID=1967839 RepID=UPI000B3CC98E|nr:LysR substrate-binding domain-containing protein [Pseudoalteromonas sp. A601]OUS71272.1 LysR family transcriptional regulator [Pseudoalteromonas sp. A601]